MDDTSPPSEPTGVHHRELTRRDFLGTASLAGASLLLGMGPALSAGRRGDGPGGGAVRVRGRVTGPRGGLSGVPVTDGLQVVTTGEDGRFRLAAGPGRGFVYISVPSGYRIPRSPTGTARFYRALEPGADRQEVHFGLEPLPVSDEEHAFLLLADIQTETREEMESFHQRTVPDLQAASAGLGDVPTFGLACGDIMFDRLELFDEYVSGAVSGAWWTGPICADGTPAGYSLYRADGEHLEWQYRATGKSADHQLRTYPPGADPGAPGEFVANVWDWDPEWTVVWYEGADRRGRMERRTGHDPLSVELHRGEDRPGKRPWVDPYRTRHLFYAPAPGPDAEVVVEATDRFGRTYSSRVPTREGGDRRPSPAGSRRP